MNVFLALYEGFVYEIGYLLHLVREPVQRLNDRNEGKEAAVFKEKSVRKKITEEIREIRRKKNLRDIRKRRCHVET